MTLTRRGIIELLRAHDLRPSRALGQNFVADPNTVRRIARLAAVGTGDHVIEIGAGLGSLTLALAETNASVIAVEADRHVVPLLREVLSTEGALAPEGRVQLVHADAMELAWDDVLAAAPHWVLVANLPYNIATPLVIDVLDGVPAVERLLVMVQREVAERLAAAPGDPAYGIPSVKVRYWATAKLVGRVGPDVFVPRPRVESALVEIVRRAAPAVDVDSDPLFALVRTAFGQRRKMLRRSLAGVVDGDGFAKASVAPEARPEQLDVDDWARLTRAANPGL